ncbi:MAG: phage tail protein [Anaerolineaceae bacterium]|nr:phage tail protein [Anaerolineaceae bacterium]
MLNSISNNFDLNPLDVYYALDVNEARLATFASLSGGDIEISVIKHNVLYASGELGTLMIPGQSQYSPVVLEKGYGNTKELYNWFVSVNSGKIFSARKNVSISLNAFTEDGYVPLITWNLINTWPTKISGFESSQSDTAKVAKFSITLIAEAIERVDP